MKVIKKFYSLLNWQKHSNIIVSDIVMCKNLELFKK